MCIILDISWETDSIEFILEGFVVSCGKANSKQCGFTLLLVHGTMNYWYLVVTIGLFVKHLFSPLDAAYWLLEKLHRGQNYCESVQTQVLGLFVKGHHEW
mmetsp:Transcript_37448/g.57451  ORF Transcript_37448/g.57451 Transcript_37448/m.57451 type:complete len:100 (+) Transcript_37448:219-518(+)